MGNKIDGDMCYAAALPDEPMFVLLARDPFAPQLVRDWAHQRQVDINNGERPAEDEAKVHEALEQAGRMESWRVANNGKWRRPEFQCAAPNYNPISAAFRAGHEAGFETGFETRAAETEPVELPITAIKLEALEAAFRAGWDAGQNRHLHPSCAEAWSVYKGPKAEVLVNDPLTGEPWKADTLNESTVIFNGRKLPNG